MKIPHTLPVPDKREFWATLDSTKLQTYDRCARKYFYEYVLGWRPDKVSNHLVFGQAWHEALEFLYKEGLSPVLVPDAFERFLDVYRKELPPETDEWFKGKQPHLVPSALFDYCKLYYKDEQRWNVLATEVGGKIPIANDREIVVKMDLLVEDKTISRICALEHKTGSQAGQTWENQWATSLQIGAYLHGLAAIYCEKAKDAQIIVNGTFFYTKKQAFLRVPCRRSGWEMLDWLDSVNHLWDRIEDDFQLLSYCSDSATTLEAFHKSPTACTDFSRCDYFDLCTSIANPLQYVNRRLSGFKEFWWNPLAEVKEELTKGE